MPTPVPRPATGAWRTALTVLLAVVLLAPTTAVGVAVADGSRSGLLIASGNQTVREGATVRLWAQYPAWTFASTRWEVSADGGATWDVAGGSSYGCVENDDLVLICDETVVLGLATPAMSGTQTRSAMRAQVSDPWQYSTVGTITVLPPIAPTITDEPDDVVVVAGDPATFTARAGGAPAPSVRWRTRAGAQSAWEEVTDASTTTLTLPAVGFDDDGRQYQAVFTNAGGTAASRVATLAVTAPLPTITQQPTDVATTAGGTAEFTAAHDSTDPGLTTQWLFSSDGGATYQDVPADVGPHGATSLPLVVSPATLGMDGWLYRVRFTTGGGLSAWSEPATLTVRRTTTARVVLTPRVVVVDEPTRTTASPGTRGT